MFSNHPRSIFSSISRQLAPVFALFAIGSVASAETVIFRFSGALTYVSAEAEVDAVFDVGERFTLTYAFDPDAVSTISDGWWNVSAHLFFDYNNGAYTGSGKNTLRIQVDGDLRHYEAETGNLGGVSGEPFPTDVEGFPALGSLSPYWVSLDVRVFGSDPAVFADRSFPATMNLSGYNWQTDFAEKEVILLFQPSTVDDGAVIGELDSFSAETLDMPLGELPPAEIIALEGTFAPGTNGAVFSELDLIRLIGRVNDLGHVLYRGALEAGVGDAVEDMNIEGVWLRDGQGTKLVSRAGDLAPGRTPEHFINGYATSEFFLNNSGDAIFFAFAEGPGIDEYNERSTIARAWDGTLVELTRHGSFRSALDPSPGLPNSNVTEVTPTGDLLLTGRLWDGGDKNGRFELLTGPYTGPADEQSYQMLLDYATPAPGVPEGVGMFSVSSLQRDAQGRLAWSGTLDYQNGIGPSNDFGYWADLGSGPQLLLREGVQAPGLPNGALVLARDNSRFTGVEEHRLAVVARLQTGSGGVTSANDRILYSTTDSGFQPLAREGSTAPGLAAGVKFADTFGFAGDLSANDGGEVGFTASLAGGDTVAGQNDFSAWTNLGGTLRKLSRGSEQAPGFTDGSVHWTPGLPRLSSQGCLVLEGSVTDDISHLPHPIFRNCLWGLEEGGSLELLVYEGMAHLRGDGSLAPVDDVQFEQWLSAHAFLYSIRFSGSDIGYFIRDVREPDEVFVALDHSLQLDGEPRRIAFSRRHDANAFGQCLFAVTLAADGLEPETSAFILTAPYFQPHPLPTDVNLTVQSPANLTLHWSDNRTGIVMPLWSPDLAHWRMLSETPTGPGNNSHNLPAHNDNLQAQFIRLFTPASWQ